MYPLTTKEIVNEDLYVHTYPIHILEACIVHFNFKLKTLLHTQRLTATFCAKYILNEEYAITNADTYIGITEILMHQPHISYAELYREIQLQHSNSNIEP